jgi:predicted Rossmann fold nucleotide-binding protein DprA/Smf involved in DNA uptake
MASRWRADLASGLVERGVAVVSGGAYGIDGAAHRAALAAEGVTVAVMAGDQLNGVRPLLTGPSRTWFTG